MNYQFMRRSHVLLPTMPSGTTRTNRRAATATEARNSNPSGVQKSNRVSTWLLRVSTILTLLLSGGMCFEAYAYEDLPLLMDECVPSEGNQYATLSSVKLSFDISDISLEGYGSYGIKIAMTSKKQLKLYKGTPETGELIASIRYSLSNTSPDFKLDDNSVIIPLEDEYVLEPDVEYSIEIPDVISLIIPESTTTVAKFAGATINFYGKEASADQLIRMSTTPASNSTLSSLDDLRINFNQPVKVAEGAKAVLLEGEDTVIESDIKINEENNSEIVVFFDNEVLYTSHSYKVIIPKDAIQAAANSELTNNEISIPYVGGGYRYFGYQRVMPGNNRTVEYLSDIEVALNCTDDEYIGRTFKTYANFYKVVNDELIPLQERISCKMSNDTKGFIIPIFDFNLEPSSTYQVIVDAAQFSLWSYTTGKVISETTNEKLVLTYHTPDIFTPLPRQGFDVATPVDDAILEKLESFKLTFAPYTFEYTFYYPVFAGDENGYNVLKFVDETTGEETGSFQVVIKGKGDSNFWIENVNPLDFTLLNGHTYKVIIPAGMFCCSYDVLHDVSLNEEFIITYEGATRTTTDVTCNYGDAFSITNTINPGESTTLRFTPSEEWAVDTVTVNGEEAELTDGVLVLSDVTEDMNVSVSYKFIGGISFNYSTGVDGVEDDCPYFVALGESYVALSGLEIGSTVEVYNTVGMLLGTSVATDSEVKIDTVPGLAIVVIRKTDAAPVAITVRIP